MLKRPRLATQKEAIDNCLLMSSGHYQSFEASAVKQDKTEPAQRSQQCGVCWACFSLASSSSPNIIFAIMVSHVLP